MPRLDIQYLRYEIIAQKAEEFLSRYRPSGTIPIPIEEIAEFRLGVDIVPIPNLRRGFETDGFTSSDLKQIYVDEHLFSEFPARYRFTLAHEVAHIVLHKRILEKIKISSLAEWKKFIENIDPRDYSVLEFQGYAFAGLVLVPPRDLKKLLLENITAVNPLIKKTQAQKIPRKQYIAYAKDFLATKLAPKFEVSTDVIIKRIELDNLERFIP
jgi:Zn-dependent peptidase ImmA (M78 family)